MGASLSISPRAVGRYELHDELASGGMATVYYGRLVAPLGFARTVAIKRLHPHLAKDPEFLSMFVDEVRLAARVRHPNVVSTLDVVNADGESFLVMEHVLGEALSRLMRAANDEDERIPPAIAAGILCGALHGLHAAHEATNEHGEPLHIVHRDVSPQNILVGAEGVPRLIDFGVAKAAGNLRSTGEGTLKGKIRYMSPEQLAGEKLDRRSDVYAAGVVLWELLVGKSLIAESDPVVALRTALEQRTVPPRTLVPDVPPELDAAVMRALSRDRAKRFATARQMALAIEASTRVASSVEIAEWVNSLAGAVLGERRRRIAEIESGRSEMRRTLPDTGSDTQVATIAEAPSGRAARHGWKWAAIFGAVATIAAASTAFGWTRVRTRGKAPDAAPPVVATQFPTTTEPAAITTSAPPPTPEAAPKVAAAPAAPRLGATGGSRSPRTTQHAPSRPPAPAPAPAAHPDAGCRVEQYVDADGFTRFRCAP